MIWNYDNVDIKIKVLSEESFSGNYGLGFELKMKGELVSQTIISSLHILVDLVNILNILHVKQNFYKSQPKIYMPMWLLSFLIWYAKSHIRWIV